MENPALGSGPLNVSKSEICRLCMKTHEYYLNVFVSYEELKTSISKAIEDLLVLKVAKDDNLPKMVCCQCVTKLMEFREFKEMCVNSAREFGRHAPVEPITDEFLPMHLLGEATSGTRGNCVDGESLVPVATNDLSMDPFAFENQSDSKEEYPRDPLADSDGCGEENFAETEYNEDASVCSESKSILMDDQGKVKEEVAEVVGNVESHSREIIDEGDSSDTGGPILLSDILAVMGMMDCCKNIGGPTVEPEKESDKFGDDRQGISQNEVLNNTSCDPVLEKNLQLEYSKPIPIVVDCFSESRVNKRKNNIKFYAPSKKFSQLNEREKPARNNEHEQLCQAENTSYPTEYICNYCNTRFSEKNSLALHIKIHVDEVRSASILPKNDCQPRFSQNVLVKAFKCNECGKMFNFKSYLKQHIVVHTGVKPFKCNECGKMFNFKWNLKRHTVVHTGVKTFKCNECEKIFARISELKLHSVVHTGVKAYKCNECGKMFNLKGNLKKHTVVHTGVKPFKCNECGKIFARIGELKQHSVVHTGVKAYKCNECGKTFNFKGNLINHTVVHTGVKPFKCNECGKMFNLKGNFKKHTVVHTGVKPFKCNECGKIFARICELKQHSVVHTGVKAYKGNECRKVFSQSSHLKRKSVVHTGVKPFKCNECGMMFTTSSNLKSHSRIHSGVKPFKCDFSGKQFKRRNGFKSHLLTHADRNPSK